MEEDLKTPTATGIAPSHLYQVTWMGRDGAYETRSYDASDVVIGTQDGGALVIATQHVSPVILLIIPQQRLVQVELVGA